MKKQVNTTIQFEKGYITASLISQKRRGPLQIDKFGKVGLVDPTDRYELEVRIPKHLKVFSIRQVQTKKQVTITGNKLQVHGDAHIVFIDVPVNKMDNRAGLQAYFTPSRVNNIRVAILGPNCQVYYWQVSVTIQNGVLWVNGQAKARFQFYLGADGKPKADGLRPELEEFLISELGNRKLDSEIDPEMAKVEVKDPPLNERFGRVAWYDFARQTGGIEIRRSGDGERDRGFDMVGVHVLYCPLRDGGQRYLLPGEVVLLGKMIPVKNVNSDFVAEMGSEVQLAEEPAEVVAA